MKAEHIKDLLLSFWLGGQESMEKGENFEHFFENNEIKINEDLAKASFENQAEFVNAEKR